MDKRTKELTKDKSTEWLEGYIQGAEDVIDASHRDLDITHRSLRFLREAVANRE
jgi:hypothetical protein